MTVQIGGPSEPSGAALSRELREFLVHLAIGVHRHGIYPEGHPSLAPSVEGVLDRFRPLVTERETLSLGIARGQLIIEGVATDIRNVVVTDLATRLHRHHVGALVLHRGLTGEECGAFFQAIARDPDRTGEHVGLNPEVRRAWPHLRLHPVNYARLRLSEGSEEEAVDGDTDRVRRTRAAELWLGLARAALASGDGTTHVETDLAQSQMEPTALARAISDHAREASYDQSIIGYMLQIADELSGEQTPESAGLRARVSRLISAMDAEALKDLLCMGGDDAQRRRFLLTASEGIAVDAVVDLIKAAGEEEETISHSLLRLLKKLARHAGTEGDSRKEVADTQVREQIARLVTGWSLRNPNPEAYGAALEGMSAGATPGGPAPDTPFARDPRCLIQMAVELGSWGEMVQDAADRVVADGDLPWLLELESEETITPFGHAVRARYITPAQVERALAADPIDTASLDHLVALLGVGAADPMLEALARSDASQTRPLLLDRLSTMGAGLGPLLVARLDDDRWYVTRNMLYLLDKLPVLPPGFDPTRWIGHADARVRREAHRLVHRDPEHRRRAIPIGLRDTDNAVVRLSLRAAAEDCPEAALPILTSLAMTGSDPELRFHAIRVLGRCGHPRALDLLLRLTAPRRWLFWHRAPAKTPEYLAALEGLTHFRHDTRAQATLEAAIRTRDPDLVRATRGVGGGDSTP